MIKATFYPTIIIENDYDGTFEERVERAIALNREHLIDMLPVIKIDAGPYRASCLTYNRNKEAGRVELDFYSASRVFGFNHTVEDIAQTISTSFVRIQ